jgi:PAS domain S-box-containing protein
MTERSPGQSDRPLPGDPLYGLLVESAPHGILMVGPQGSIDLVNAEAERLFGYRRSELIGQPIELLVPDRSSGRHAFLRRAFLTAPETRPMGAGRDLKAKRKDGSEFPVEIGLNAIETGETKLLLAVVIDISDRKQKEERLRAALREKELLLSEIHHRVTNNLQVISSLLDLQSARLSDPSVLSLLRDSQNRIRSMALIHQTLYRSKDFAEVDFRHFVDGLLPVLTASHGIDPERIAIFVEGEEVSLPIGTAIPCALLVNELLSNALEHAFPGDRPGAIRVGFLRPRPGTVQISVEDDGVGMPPGFEIGKADTLGLQLVALLADQVGGSLTIARAAPTRFELRFPFGG